MKIRTALASFVITATVATGMVAFPTPASAAQSGPYWCAGERRAHGNHTVQKYFAVGGWGWTNWGVNVNASAGDGCLQGRGGVNVLVSLPYSSVDYRGGTVTTAAYIRYYNQATSTAGGWIALKKINTWPSHQFVAPNGSYVTMNSTTVAVEVAVVTAAWTKQDGSNWVMLGTGHVYCNLYFTSTAFPGRCTGG